MFVIKTKLKFAKDLVKCYKVYYTTVFFTSEKMESIKNLVSKLKRHLITTSTPPQ